MRMCTRTCKDQKRVWEALELVWQMGVSHAVWVLRPNSDLLQEQEVLWTAVTFIQHHIYRPLGRHLFFWMSIAIFPAQLKISLFVYITMWIFSLANTLNWYESPFSFVFSWYIAENYLLGDVQIYTSVCIFSVDPCGCFNVIIMICGTFCRVVYHGSRSASFVQDAFDY